MNGSQIKIALAERDFMTHHQSRRQVRMQPEIAGKICRECLGQDAGRRQAAREAKERAEAEERAIVRQELEEVLKAIDRKRRRWRP
jgi:hypothetical protein